jgi:hypothetical protein
MQALQQPKPEPEPEPEPEPRDGADAEGQEEEEEEPVHEFYLMVVVGDRGCGAQSARAVRHRGGAVDARSGIPAPAPAPAPLCVGRRARHRGGE